MRIYNPYLQFVYLRNAYHFYSPEPGPASILVFLLKTENGRDPATGQVLPATYKWVVTPRRPADVRDPLGLTYYRRLSLTEQVARGAPGLALPGNYYEKGELLARRAQVGAIPFPQAFDERVLQYRLPQPEVSRFVIPSYASHIIMENTRGRGRAATTTVQDVPARAQHNARGQFHQLAEHPGVSTEPLQSDDVPAGPSWASSTRGDLVNPQEPMLYWLVPIVRAPGRHCAGGSDQAELPRLHVVPRAGAGGVGVATPTVDQLGEQRFKNLVFDWTQDAARSGGAART